MMPSRSAARLTEQSTKCRCCLQGRGHGHYFGEGAASGEWGTAAEWEALVSTVVCRNRGCGRTWLQERKRPTRCAGVVLPRPGGTGVVEERVGGIFTVAGPCQVGDCECRSYDGLSSDGALRIPVHADCTCYWRGPGAASG